MIKTFMIAGKTCVDSSGQATRKPRPVSAKPTTNNAGNKRASTAASSGTPARGAARQKSKACPTASVVPPSNFPSTIASGATGATKTPCRKPSRRSSMTEMVEKTAVKSRMSTTVPGKK